MKSILLFGDSLTQRSFECGGWGQRLAERYARRADVVNRGLSGYNTRWAIEILNGQDCRRLRLPCYSVGNKDDKTLLFATIWFGANDSSIGNQHVPLDEYRHNLGLIVRAFREKLGCERLIILSPPPVDEVGYFAYMKEKMSKEDPHEKVLESDRSNRIIGQYVQACQAVADDNDVPFIDLFEKVKSHAASQGKQLADYFHDGLHFNFDGQRLVFDALLETLTSNYPEVLVSTTDPTKYGSSCTSCEAAGHWAPWWNEVPAQQDANGKYLEAHQWNDLA